MRDIITDRVAKDIIQRFVFANLATPLPDDSDEFALVIEAFALLREARDGDRVRGAGQGGDGLVEEDGVGGDGHVGFVGVLLVVETQAADGADVFWCQGGEQEADVLDGVGYAVGAEDVTLNKAGLFGGADVGCARGEEGVAVVGFAVTGEEADETLVVVVLVAL